MRGKTFPDREKRADEMRKAAPPAPLRERAASDDPARVDAGVCGNCPRCGSDRIYPDHAGEGNQKGVITYLTHLTSSWSGFPHLDPDPCLKSAAEVGWG